MKKGTKTKRVLAFVLLFTMLIAMIPTSVFAYSQVRNGSRGQDVKTMQTMLNKVINAGLTVDGICGAKSVQAIKNFQRKYGLTADGICGKNTWAKLESAYNGMVKSQSQPKTTSRSIVRSGSRGQDVKTMQTMLNKVMQAGLTVDGICGAKSVAAIKNFQKAFGLTADGICGKNTWAKLESAYNSGKVVSKAPSSIKIGSGRYAPGTLNEGSSYSISGKITSTYSLTKVIVGVYDANNKGTSYVKTVYPNSTSYNIKNVDNYIKFGALSGSEKGTTYYFRVTATDSNGKTVQLVNNQFKVKGRAAVSLSSSKYKTMAEKTFEVQGKSACVLTSYSMLVKCKLYCENKSYSGMSQNKIKKYNGGKISANWYNINNQINAYAGTSGKITYTEKPSSNAKKYIINLLKTRPEGIVIHFWKNNNNQHAVRFCNYDSATDTFYVSDPASSRYKYVSVFDSLIGQRYGKTYDSIFSYINKIVYYN